MLGGDFRIATPKQYGVRQFIAAFPGRLVRKRKQVSALQMQPPLPETASLCVGE